MGKDTFEKRGNYQFKNKMADLKIVTFNVRGLQQKTKIIQIFNYLKEKCDKGVCILQETHSDQNTFKQWQREWGQCKSFFNHGASNARGTAILFTSDDNFKILKNIDDGTGRLQLMSVEHNNIKYLIGNIYNPNTEIEKVTFLKKFNEILASFPEIDEHHIIIGGDYNLYYDLKLDVTGGNPTLKTKSITEIIKIKESPDLCDIFRIRNPKSKWLTYRSKNPKLSRRLDQFLISNDLQQSVNKLSILPSIAMCDHSPLLLQLDFLKENDRGKGYWKFNNTLLQNDEFCSQVERYIASILRENEDMDDQVIWELIKFEIRDLAIRFSKNLAKNKREKIKLLENIIIDFESRS